MIRVEHDDMLQAIPRLVAEGVVCDAVVTDPPYHLIPTQKRFGAANSAPAQHGRDGAMARLSGGFMGQRWDGGDIAFRPETWSTVATILRPGAFLIAFGGTRTHHRLACAIEDAGFVIQDMIAWLYATGFPKRRDNLKPAIEPIVLAYKPGGPRTMQIDECRIEAESGDYDHPGDAAAVSRHDGRERWRFDQKQSPPSPLGRWPANVCHDGSDEVIGAFPESASGNSTAIRAAPYSGLGNGRSFATPAREKSYRPANEGSAARFFYAAKSDAKDRFGSRHPTVKPVDLIAWLVTLVCPPGGLFIDPFAGSGTAATAAMTTRRDAILIEREEQYVADIRARVAWIEGEGRHSIAVKGRRLLEHPMPLFAEMADAAE